MHEEKSRGSGLESCKTRFRATGGVTRERCSGIVVISAFRERAPKIHREAFATTEMSLGEPCRVPKGRLKLVPRSRWSLDACRPVLGAVYLSVDRTPGALSEMASVRDWGCPGLSGVPPKRARMCCWSLWH
ncbi:hypothetical protein CRG98_018277 [Punica granatum]|uniref:Uncharacterized protein n=1 Tax=Punica granatum TaxID=22663 RepID=A0A2I0JYJ1_PUNGR|nr:hypothetical protein CRG98_018277 [Punica granatum]